MTAAPHLDGVGTAFLRWLKAESLPIWSQAGFDQSARLFHEQLDFTGLPVAGVARRVMVQARQISVFALATRRGWGDFASLSVDAADAMIRAFWAADGEQGWVFSIDPRGVIVDARRDLYAHAFVLFALAGIVALGISDARFRTVIDDTLSYLDAQFADPDHGGFWDHLPRSKAPRSQNPHMHLLEALLELFEATGNQIYLDRATKLVGLAREHFIDPRHGALREFFDCSWQVVPGPGEGIVEPGHQFEWAWLLRRYNQLGGRDHSDLSEGLVRFALRFGIDVADGRIVDQTNEQGFPLQRSSRCWPHCEAIKSLAVETSLGTSDHRALLRAISARLLGHYCVPSLNGGWIDQLDAADSATSKVMPASTLYHLVSAGAVWEASGLAE